MIFLMRSKALPYLYYYSLQHTNSIHKIRYLSTIGEKNSLKMPSKSIGKQTALCSRPAVERLIPINVWVPRTPFLITYAGRSQQNTKAKNRKGGDKLTNANHFRIFALAAVEASHPTYVCVTSVAYLRIDRGTKINPWQPKVLGVKFSLWEMERIFFHWNTQL